MKKLVGAFCVITAVFIVGSAALQAAQDQSSVQSDITKTS